MANARDVDALLTDEFRNLARFHALIENAPLITTPRLLREYARNGFLRPDRARLLIDTIAPHRSWETSSYVQAVRSTL